MVVPECFNYDIKSHWKSMENWEIWHLTVPETPEWMATKMGCGWWCYYDPIRGFCSPPHAHRRVQSDLAVFWGFCRHRTEKPLHRFWRSVRQMMSFRARMCLLQARKQKFSFQPHSPPQKKKFFGQFLTGLGKFCVKKALTVAMLICKLHLIVIVAPWKLYSE